MQQAEMTLPQKSHIQGFHGHCLTPALTSHMMSRPDLVTPAFCVLPADTCTTSVLSMGRRRGVVIPLPQVYMDESGGGIPVLAEPPRTPMGQKEMMNAEP